MHCYPVLNMKRSDRPHLHSGYAGYVSPSHRPMLVFTEGRRTYIIMETFQQRSMEAF